MGDSDWRFDLELDCPPPKLEILEALEPDGTSEAPGDESLLLVCGVFSASTEELLGLSDGGTSKDGALSS